MTNPACLFKDVGSIVADDVDAIELSKTLGRHGNEDTGAVLAEHLGVCPLTLLSLEKHVHLNFAILVSGLLVVDVTLAVEVGNDNDTFFVVIVVKEPSGHTSGYRTQNIHGTQKTNLGDSTMTKLPKPRRAPITHCIRRGTRHDMSLLIKPQK